MNLSGIPPPLKSFSFHSYEFNKIKTFTNLRLEKYYQSYSFRAFFSFNSFSLISLLFSPKRILKKKSLFSHRKVPLLRFPSFQISRAQLQTNPRDLYPTTIPITNFPLFILPTLTTLTLSLSLFFETSTYKIHRKESQTLPKVPLTPNSTLTPFQPSREQLLNRSNPNQTFLGHPLNRITCFIRDHKNGFLHLFIFYTREVTSSSKGVHSDRLSTIYNSLFHVDRCLFIICLPFK